MKNVLKLVALMSLALLSNFALYSTSAVKHRQVVPKKISPFSQSSKPVKSPKIAKNYKAEFLNLYGKDLKACSPAKQEIMLAIVEANIPVLRKLITAQNVNDMFEIRSLKSLEMRRTKVPFGPSLIKVPYLGIAVEAYCEALNKQAEDQALLAIKELLKLGANPNKARVTLSGFRDDLGKHIDLIISIPVIDFAVQLEDPVLFELFLQHKGDLNDQIRLFYKGKMSKKSGYITIAEQAKLSKNPKMKALVHKYADNK